MSVASTPIQIILDTTARCDRLTVTDSVPFNEFPALHRVPAQTLMKSSAFCGLRGSILKFLSQAPFCMIEKRLTMVNTGSSRQFDPSTRKILPLSIPDKDSDALSNSQRDRLPWELYSGSITVISRSRFSRLSRDVPTREGSQWFCRIVLNGNKCLSQSISKLSRNPDEESLVDILRSSRKS
jgi:hypothetical protein